MHRPDDSTIRYSPSDINAQSQEIKQLCINESCRLSVRQGELIMITTDM